MQRRMALATATVAALVTGTGWPGLRRTDGGELAQLRPRRLAGDASGHGRPVHVASFLLHASGRRHPRRGRR